MIAELLRWLLVGALGHAVSRLAPCELHGCYWVGSCAQCQARVEALGVDGVRGLAELRNGLGDWLLWCELCDRATRAVFDVRCGRCGRPALVP